METPDAAYVRLRSRLNLTDLGFPPPEVSSPDPLQEEVADAVEYVENVTWRKLDGTMPDQLARSAAKAVWLRTEQQVVIGEGDMVETANDELVSSFSAGGYSETRKDPGRRGEQTQVSPNPDLSRLLWLVMTPEARLWWRAYLKGEPMYPPGTGFNVVEVGWNLRHAAPYADVQPGYLLPPSYGDLDGGGPIDPEPYIDPMGGW